MRRRRLASSVSFALLLGAGAACVIAQPTNTVPSLPASRPVIIQARLDPPTTSVLMTWPKTLTVPVELVDPTMELQYTAFSDYNPLVGGTILGRGVDVLDSTTVPSDRVRSLSVAISPSIDLDRCHVIEVVVSATFDGFDSRTLHTPPDPPGGDSATWFYAPGGDLTGCPSLDAGIDASIIEDASDSGAR